jgi:hypothetical protein
MKGRSVGALFACAALVVLVLAAPAAADMRYGTLAYRHGTERPRIEYRVFWGAVDDTTVRTTKIVLRAHNPERPGSSRNWASVTVFVGGVHPGVGEPAWDGHGDWSAIAPSGGSKGDLKSASGVPRAEGAEAVWSTELYLGSGAWKTRYVPVDQRRSVRYETWIRVLFHAPGRSQYWFRLTTPLG